MGKKKAFVDKKTAKRFKLLPSTGQPSSAQPEQGKKFVPTQEHLDEQHKYGVYYDDDYDYMQHLRDVKEGFQLTALDADEEEEERVIVKAPKIPMAIPSMLFGQGPSAPVRVPREVYDEDVARALEGDIDISEEGGLEDDFIAMAGGAVPGEMLIRESRESDEESDDEESDFDYDDEDYGYGDGDMMEGEAEFKRPEIQRDGPRRDIDNAFEHMLETAYNDDQMGELDGDDETVAGFLEPEDGRLHRLVGAKEKLPATDEEGAQMAKDYVLKRMALLEAGVIKEDEETEIVEVEETAKKRMKWDCESFATQYTNIYNHPTLIKDAVPAGNISRRALKRLDRETREKEMEEAMEQDGEEESDDESVCTVSTFRPKGETTEERKLRKQAVKEARRSRREEKKMNKTAFTEEFRKAKQSRFGQVKMKTIV